MGKKNLAKNKIEFLFDCLCDRNWYFCGGIVCEEKC